MFKRLSMLTLTGLVASAAGAAPLTLNLPQTFADTRNILAANGAADIVVLGDSLSFRPGTYVPPLTQLLQHDYGNAGAGYQDFSVFTGATISSTWISGPINQDPPPHRGLAGLWSQASGGGSGNMQPLNTRFELHYLKQPGGGRFTPQVRTAGGEMRRLPVVNTNDTGIGVGVWTYDRSPQDFTLDFQVEAGQNVTLLGANHAFPGSSGIRVHRAANGGFGVNNFLNREASFDGQLSALGAELIMVWLGQNDQGFTQQQYTAQMGLLVDRLQLAAPGAEILLIGTTDQGAAPLAGLVEGVADLAAQRGLGFINLYALAGDYQFLQSNGYLDDGVHFSTAGGQYIANILFSYFDANLSAARVPEASLVGISLGALAVMRRRPAR